MMRSDRHHPGLDDDTNSNNAMERSSRDLLSLKNSKYMKQIDNIYEMSHLAKKLDILKMSHMTEINPDYKLTKNSGFSLNPRAQMRRKRSEDDINDTTEKENTKEKQEH